MSFQSTRHKYGFSSAVPPPSFLRHSVQDAASQDVKLHPHLRKTTAEAMLNPSGKIQEYDPLSDPNLAPYFARKFGWTSAIEPPSHGGRGPKPGRRRPPTVVSGARVEPRVPSDTLRHQRSKRKPVRPDPGSVASSHTKKGVRGEKPKPKPGTKVGKSGKGGSTAHDGPVDYTLEFSTSSKSSRSSKSEKLITLVGTKGTSPAFALSAPGVHFRQSSKDVFRVQTPEHIGKLTKVVIENTGQLKSESWRLSKLVVTRMRSGKLKERTFEVPANCWFSKHHGDHKLKRTLLVTAVEDAEQEFDVEVVTADARFAGTDANVFITLIGSKGSSARTPLRPTSSKDPFERGNTDHFHIATIAVGKVERIRIEHDGRGAGSGWKLEKVVVRPVAERDVSYTFLCGEWLDVGKPGGALRELLAQEMGQPTEYIIMVQTGDRRGAGTDANVFVILYGEKGESGPHLLETLRHNDFERGSAKSYIVKSASVGKLTHLRVYHDNSGMGPGWFLEKIEVVDSADGAKYPFPCSRWLSKDEDDGAISRHLPLNGVGRFAAQTYKLHVQTGDVRAAGTSANVYARLDGEDGSTGRVPLENSSKNFSRNRTDVFLLEADNIGALSRLVLGHDNTGSGAGWYVETVKVEDLSRGFIYKINVQRWFAADEDDNALERVFQLSDDMADVVDAKSFWRCAVKTSDVRFGGTDANVFIQVYGTKGKSVDIPLRNKTDNFERDCLDEFKIELPNVGKLRKLRVWHDDKGATSGWHLDSIELSKIDTGDTYTFHCAQWLATDQDDGEIIRELPATGPLVKKPLVPLLYRVRTFTGSKRGAGTDSNVFVTLFGKHGDSGERPLRKSSTHRNKFENGHEDIFLVHALTLGDLSKIRIRHDNAGASSSWFLDKVEVDVLKPDTDHGDTFVFPCSKWLSHKEGDGQIDRELMVLGSDAMVAATVTYTVRVKTGSVKNASTDADVYLTIFGKKGDTGQLRLLRSETFKDPFERNHVDVFHFELQDIGELTKIVIGHDNSGLGSAWFLDDVIVEVPSTGKTYSFPCHRWLAKDEDDGLCERELYVSADGLDAEAASIPAVVRVFTSDVLGAGTDANVTMVVSGDAGKTDPIPLVNKSNNFERGDMDEFKLNFKDVGTINKIRIAHDNKGGAAAWHLDKVEIHLTSSNKVFTFQCGEWLSKKKGNRRISVELPIHTIEKVVNGERVVEETFDIADQKTLYKVEVFTGDVFGAGTDANVFINLHGSKGDSGERHLTTSSTNMNKFERRCVDVFEVEAVSLGTLSKLRVWHDDKGGGSAWFLDKIIVTDMRDEQTYFFPCDKWLSKSDGDKLISRELGAVDDLPREVQTKAVITSYNVSVFTSDIRYAGTDANVSVCLYGEGGDTGDIALEKSLTNSNKWERGKVDKFKIEAADLGELSKIRIGHDGAGAGAGWHLDKVIVDCPLLGKTWTFPCRDWLDKGMGDGTLERVLKPEKETEYHAKVAYEVTVRTSDVSGAGTDANVFMDVYGHDSDGTVLSAHYDFDTSEKRHFERGDVDTFNIELEYVGEPFKLRIGHDNKGMGAAWHLDSVTLVNQHTHDAFSFPCGKWLAKGKDDGKIVRELAIGSIKQLAEDGTVEEVDMGDALDEVTYTIRVKTSDMKGAGTDANVTMIMYGAKGDSGEVKLSKSSTYRNKFERNHEDVFEHKCLDLGELERVRIWHDNAGMGASWHLDKIEVEPNPNEEGRLFLFKCNNWLSKKDGDKQIQRELPVFVDAASAKAQATALAQQAEDMERTLKHAQRHGSKKMAKEAEEVAAEVRERADAAAAEAKLAQGGSGANNIQYMLTITTADEPNAATGANVFVEFIGEKKRVARLSGDALRRPSTASSVRSLSSASRRDSSRGSPLASTKTTVVKSGSLTIPDTKGAFKRGKVFRTTLMGVDVGFLKQLRIGHDGAGVGDGWLLGTVVVEVPTWGKKFTFVVNDWIATDQGDGKLEKLLTPDSLDDIEEATPYEIDVFTSDLFGAGTNGANVTLTLCGDEGEGEPFTPQSSIEFDRNTTVTLRQEIRHIGMLSKVRVRHRSRALKGGAWHLDKLVVRNLSTGSEATFVFGEWLKKSDEQHELVAQGVSGTTDASAGQSVLALDQKTYEISVETGNVSRAGTDANVKVILFGALGQSAEIPLKKSETHKDPFEKGHTDVFTVTTSDLGKLTKLRIWHDNAKMFASWFLEQVVIVETGSKSRFVFPCQRWLSKDKDDKQTMRELPCVDAEHFRTKASYKILVSTKDELDAGITSDVLLTVRGAEQQHTFTLACDKQHFYRGKTDQFAFEGVPALGELTSAKVELVGDDVGTDAWIVDSIVVKDLGSGQEYQFGNKFKPIKTKASLQLVQMEDKTEAHTASKPVLYEVCVKTGNVRGAGTDSRIKVIIYGANGDSGERELAKSKTYTNKFERNHEDKFDMEILDLGQLSKIKVWVRQSRPSLSFDSHSSSLCRVW
eukprot:m.131391 g.131391  ORF g.131391 m.131391 type:complete len:2461 (+) comp13915_c0_seq1:231-7613(+)